MLKLHDGAEFKATPNSFSHAFTELAFCTGMCMYEHMYSFMITGWIMLTHVRKCQFSLLHKAATKCVKGRRGLKRLHVQCCVSYHEPFKQHPGNFQLDETESTKCTKCFQFWLPIIFKLKTLLRTVITLLTMIYITILGLPYVTDSIRWHRFN